MLSFLLAFLFKQIDQYTENTSILFFLCLVWRVRLELVDYRWHLDGMNQEIVEPIPKILVLNIMLTVWAEKINQPAEVRCPLHFLCYHDVYARNFELIFRLSAQ